jgi:hypothetical protein
MPKNVVWTAVSAAGTSVASVITALAGLSELSLSLGLVAIASAVLAGREK